MHRFSLLPPWHMSSLYLRGISTLAQGEHYAYRLSPPPELALEGAARTMAAKTEANLFIFPPIQERL